MLINVAVTSDMPHLRYILHCVVYQLETPLLGTRNIIAKKLSQRTMLGERRFYCRCEMIFGKQLA
uniref:Uncharacterized protein n=1 Tax=Phenylobacterium glaciei TaxID=2803784 RepID=A0A974SA60_9CAUL|nr:hypothetical protein JKL49_11795 [Phenylobacterium glaciei]